tara:strand:- start:111 stop:488 length:378 start_codon:yes stop_codon:yes gene_type:complete
MDVQKILQSRGLKLTKSRQAIVSVFEHQKKPLSAKEIFDALGQVYNKVTIYRNIYALEDLGLLTVDVFAGQKRYCLKEKKHHHVTCTKCGESACLPCHHEFDGLKNFVQVNHEVVISGICVSCNK